MSDRVEDHKHELESTRADRLASALRAAAGAAPVIGGLLAELVNVSIPRLREERLADFARRMESKIADLSEDVLSAAMQTPGLIDLTEEAVQQVLRAQLEDRRERIACLVREALTVEKQDLDRMQRLLAILGQLNDSELVILRSHAFSEQGRQAREANWELVHGRPVPHAEPEGEKNKECIRRSYVEHLVALGLLERQIHAPRDSDGHEMRVPEIDSFTKRLRTSEPRITELGEVLLRAVGHSPKDP